MKTAGQATTAAPLIVRPYFRVSRDHSGELRSPKEQAGDFDHDVVEHGWTAGDSYAEKKAISASRYSKTARLDFDELVTDLREDTFAAQIFWLWEPSRGSRKVSEWATLCELCEERGVKVYVHTHGRLYDPGNARDRRSMLEDAVDAEYETARASERVLRSVRARADAARPHGKLNYGYRRVYDISPGGRKTFVEQIPDETQALVVKELFSRVADGEGLQSIATSFRHRGIAPPRQTQAWRTPSMANMIRCRAYLGERVYRGQTVAKDAWPAIVDEGLFIRANAMLSRPGRAPRTDPTVKHLLSGIARCGPCGGPLYRSGGGKQTASTYYCADRNCVGRNAVQLEGYVIPRVVAVLAARQVGGDDGGGVDAEVEEAQREVAELRARMDGFLDAAADGAATEAGVLSAASLARIEARLRPKIDAAERRLKQLVRPRSPGLSRVDGAIEDVWDDLDVGLQRELIRGAVEVQVWPTGRGRKAFDPTKIVITPK